MISTISFTHGSFNADASKTSPVYEQQLNGTYLLVNKKVSSIPPDHIPPVYGKSGLSYAYKIFNTEFSLLYKSWKRLDQMNASGEDNAQYGTQDGFPS